jgi:glycosyltransferase involved in cell wall biosynthesis
MMGGGTRSYEFSKRLVERGNEVYVISASNERNDSEIIDGINIDWIKVPYSNHMNFYQRIKAFLIFSIKSFFVARKISCDVVFATSTPLTIALPAIFLSKIYRVKFIFEVRDLWPSIPIAMKIIKNPLIIFIAKRLEKSAYKNADAVIALSPGMKKGIEEVFFHKKIDVIPNCSDTKSFIVEKNFFQCPTPFDSGKRIILYPGTLGVVNGCEYLVDLAFFLGNKTNEIAIAIVGDGIQKEMLVEKSKKNGTYGKNLFFLDSVEKNKIPYYFHKSSAIISTVMDVKALEDNSANKFFDALAAGKPIFINHGGWQADLITNFKNGLVLNRDINCASNQILDFIFNDLIVSEAGNRSLRLAKEKFDRDLLFEKFYSIFISTFK